MNDAQKRMAKKVLSMNSARKDKKQDLNSSLYDKRVFNETREGLADYPADKLKAVLSGYITDPIFITGVTNDNGNITVNYRFLDENLNEEFMNAEIGYGLDYIENVHLYASRQGTCSGRTPMIHRLKSVNSSKLTADQAKNKYKELLTQCYIAVYDHKLDVNDPQVVEYRKQMNTIKSEFGDIANTMDGYIKSLDKKYKNSIDFTSEDLDSGLFSKKEKPSEEILKMYKQLKKSIDNLIKAGTPASNSNLKNMQNKASEFEKKYDAKALKMALAASRRKINCSAENDAWKETYHVNADGTLASMVHYNDITGEYDGEVVWIDKNGEPQQKQYKGEYNPRLAFVPFVGYWIKSDTKDTTVSECDSADYIEACNTIKEAVKNKWNSNNSSRRAVVNSSQQKMNCMTQRAYADELVIYINLIPNDVTTTKAVVKGAVTESTGEYNFTVYSITPAGKFNVQTLTGILSINYFVGNQLNEARLLNNVKAMLLQEIGTDDFIECDDDKVVYAQIEDLKSQAEFTKAQQRETYNRQHADNFEREYGVRPENWNPMDELMANSSRRRVNSSRRRRLNSAVANTEDCYFITEDHTLAANLTYDSDGSFIIGFIRGQRADGTLVDEDITEPCHTDVPVTLMWDLIEDITGRDDFVEISVNEFNDILLDVNALFTDKRKSRLDKYVDYRRNLK
jgi:hypothetical protein